MPVFLQVHYEHRPTVRERVAGAPDRVELFLNADHIVALALVADGTVVTMASMASAGSRGSTVYVVEETVDQLLDQLRHAQAGIS